MDDETLWGAAFLIYILSAAPKYFMATGDAENTIKNPKSYNTVFYPWIAGFALIMLGYVFSLNPVGTFVFAIVVWIAGYLWLKSKK